VTATTALALLDVAYNPLMADNPLQRKLKDGGMKFVIQHVDKVDFLPLQYMSPLIGTQILQQLQQVLAPNWRSMVLSSPRSNNSESPRKFSSSTVPSAPDFSSNKYTSEESSFTDDTLKTAKSESKLVKAASKNDNSQRRPKGKSKKDPPATLSTTKKKK